MRAAPRYLAVAALIPAATLSAAAIGFALGVRWLLPLLEAAPAWCVMVIALRRAGRAPAVALLVWWAVCLALTTITLTHLAHDRAEQVILNAPEYRNEMISWISTGVGRESTPSRFIPQHLAHTAIFCALSLATASAASIAMGAALLSYMSFYVGDLLVRCSGSPAHATAMLIAFNPWSIVRVISFVILGVTLAEPLLSRAGWPIRAPGGRARWLAAAGAGLLIDILLKSLLAPQWPGLLRACLG